MIETCQKMLKGVSGVIPHSFKVKDDPTNAQRKLVVFQVNTGPDGARKAIETIKSRGWPQVPDDGFHDGQFSGTAESSLQEVRMPFVPVVEE